MPIGKMKWYDKDRGFGFVSNPDGEDVYVGHAVLPEGVEELHQGQRIEYDYADGRPGPQALRISVLSEPQRRGGRGRGGQGGRGQGARKPVKRHSPSELNGMISDMISMLENTVQHDLKSGRYPDRKHGHQVAEVLRAVARELDA
ncbi:cold-shock protein [Corynebacterium sp. H113]|uniref:cold-shock protein n=1 Tax=Corynebacterium sp. H113 TaxID=3133419 RepID=UPI00309E9BF5